MQTHGVNNAMALKAAPIWWLLTGNPNDRAALSTQLSELYRYHGLPNGMFSGDEHFAGRDPSQGIELCAIVESMFSLEDAFAILGDAELGDRLERIAYNALPATLSNDMCRINMTSSPIRSRALAPTGSGRRMGMNRICSGWLRISVAAPRICTRVGLNLWRVCG